MTGRLTSACSDKCRAAKSRRRRVVLPVDEAKMMQESLTAALESLYQVKTTVERRQRHGH
jgi:hypothetical protein